MNFNKFLCASILAAGTFFPAFTAEKIPNGVMGYNVHMVDSVGEDWKDYEKQLDQIQKEGVRWIRTDHYFRAIRRADGTWDFSEPDAFFKATEKRGINVLPVLIASNQHIPQGLLPVHQNLDKICSYIRTFCERYKGIVNTYQISNEPDGGNAGSTLIECNDPEIYIKILAAISQTIREVNPNAVIVGAAPTSDTPNFTKFGWFEKALAAGMADYCDVLAVHSYIDPAHPEEFYEPGLKQVRELLKKYGADKKPLWITEFGECVNKKPYDWYEFWQTAFRKAGMDPSQMTLCLLSDAKQHTYSSSSMTDDEKFFKMFKAVRKVRFSDLPSLKANTVLPLPAMGDFPADELKNILDYMKRGGTLLTSWTPPFYCPATVMPGGYRKFQNCYRDHLPKSRLGWDGFWTDKSVPRTLPALRNAAEGLPPVDGKMAGRILTRKYLAPGDELIPLIYGDETERYPVAGIFKFNSDYKGRAIVSLLWDFKYRGSTAERAGKLIPREILLQRANGIEKCFYYKFRIIRPIDWGVHGNGVDSIWEPNDGALALATVNKQIPDDCKVSIVHRSNPWIVRAVHPDGKETYAVWLRDGKGEFHLPSRKISSITDYLGNSIEWQPDKPLPISDKVVYIQMLK